MWKLLLILPAVTACTTDGNLISARWATAPSPVDGPAGGCVGDARIEVRSGATAVSDTVACDDLGFELVVPFEIQHATVEIYDGWSERWTREVDLDGDLDLGVVWFDHD